MMARTMEQDSDMEESEEEYPRVEDLVMHSPDKKNTKHIGGPSLLTRQKRRG